MGAVQKGRLQKGKGEWAKSNVENEQGRRVWWNAEILIHGMLPAWFCADLIMILMHHSCIIVYHVLRSSGCNKHFVCTKIDSSSITFHQHLPLGFDDGSYDRSCWLDLHGI